MAEEVRSAVKDQQIVRVAEEAKGAGGAKGTKDAKDLKEVMDKAEISLILDTYDDIFSDFDPRPYNERALSEDFLVEARKAALDKKSGIVLNFLIPMDRRSSTNEELIRQRLKSHFRKHYRFTTAELNARRRQASILIGVGLAIGAIVVGLLSLNNLDPVLQYTVEIILTPASWYTIWNGFDNLLTKPREVAVNRRFYRKMMDAHITFTSY